MDEEQSGPTPEDVGQPAAIRASKRLTKGKRGRVENGDFLLKHQDLFRRDYMQGFEYGERA